MPDEPVKAIGLEAVIGLHRDKDAEAVAKLKDSSHARESADGGDDQSQVADRVAVDRTTVETIEMRWEPCERDGEDNQRNENPAAGGIFSPANSETAASGKAVSDCAGQGQHDYACTRRIRKERCPIAPTPNNQRQKQQCSADCKSEVLNDVIQKKVRSKKEDLEVESKTDESDHGQRRSPDKRAALSGQQLRV